MPASKSILPRFSISCCSRWPEHISCDSCVKTSAEASSPPLLPYNVVFIAASDRDTSSVVWTEQQRHQAFPWRSSLLTGQCKGKGITQNIKKSFNKFNNYNNLCSTCLCKVSTTSVWYKYTKSFYWTCYKQVNMNLWLTVPNKIFEGRGLRKKLHKWATFWIFFSSFISAELRTTSPSWTIFTSSWGVLCLPPKRGMLSQYNARHLSMQWKK